MTESTKPASSDKSVPNWIPILANPISGRRRRDEILNRAVELLTSKGFKPQLFTDQRLFAEAVANSYLQENLYCIVAAGGDGTVRWVLNLRIDKPLAILPLGSENLFARQQGIPIDPTQWVDIVVARRTAPLDLATLNESTFSLMASVGFDADVVRRVHLRRRGHVGRIDYLRAIFRSLRRYMFPEISIRLDGVDVGVASQVFIFNQPAYALNLPICRDAVGDDGLLDVVYYRAMSHWRLFRFAVGMMLGIPCFLPPREHRKASKISISAQSKLSIQADGDPAGTLPVDIEILPAALHLIVSNGPKTP